MLGLIADGVCARSVLLAVCSRWQSLRCADEAVPCAAKGRGRGVLTLGTHPLLALLH